MPDALRVGSLAVASTNDLRIESALRATQFFRPSINRLPPTLVSASPLANYTRGQDLFSLGQDSNSLSKTVSLPARLPLLFRVIGNGLVYAIAY